ncbi:MAG: hypothetical protein ACODAE_01190 [Gemmatimonadota bacterium]
MERAHVSRGLTLALATGLALVLALVPVAEAAAQQATGRFRVVLPRMERQGDVDGGFDEDVIEDLRELIDELPTHAPVDEDEFEDTLDQFDVDENDLNCVYSRQIAIQMGAQLVMCGTVAETETDDQVRVSVRFVMAESGDEFEVPTFTASEDDPEEAASRVFSTFQGTVDQIRFTGACWEYINNQAYEDALRACGEAIDLNDTSARALYGRAYALFMLGENAREGEEETTEGQIAEAPAETMTSEARDLYEQSLEGLQRVLELQPQHDDALKTAGLAAAHLEQRQLAREYFTEYLDLNPGDIAVRLRNAIDLANAGDPEGALRLAEEGLAEVSAEENLELVKYAGHFALRSAQQIVAESGGSNGDEEIDPEAVERFEQALDYYGQVFDLEGEESDVIMLRNMIATLTELGRDDEAAELATDILAAVSDDASLWSTYARVLNGLGRIDDALAALDSVEAIDSEYPNVRQRKAMYMVRADRIEEARPLLDEAIEAGDLQSDVAARNIFAFGYNEKYQDDLHDEALEVFEVAAEYAESEMTVGMINYFTGYLLYLRGRQLQEPNTLEAARESLPVFERALELVESSEPWAETQSSINLTQLIDGIEQHIEISELLIERG